MAKRTKKLQPSAERITIPHERASGYRVIFADGALMRRQKNDLLVTFYHDDAPVRSETAEYMREADGSSKLRPLSDFKQDFVRSHEVTVRMRLEDAAALVVALVTRLSKEAPELLKDSGVEMVGEEGVP